MLVKNTFYSPLRYPGGKNKLSKFISKICELNSINGHYIEPYAGGASVALYLLIKRCVKEVTINDLDKAIFAFWYSVLNKTNNLCKLVLQTEVTISNWKIQKKVHENKDREKDIVKLGFSTLFLNRTNYSGIINGGVIGGIKQTGVYKLDCRFNKDEIISKIQLIAKFRKKIHLKNLDALKLINKIRTNKNTIFYFDPPYYLKGPSLYMNAYKHDDHIRVSKEIRKILNAHWIISYDDNSQINKIYPKEISRIKYSLPHSARTIRKGKEVLFFSKKLILPKIQNYIFNYGY